MICPCCGYGGDLNISLDRNVVTGKDWFVKLPGMQAVILSMLIKNKSKTVTLEHMINSIYNLDEPEYSEEVIRLQVSKLRKALVSHGVVIETDWGRGYRLP